MPMGVVAKVEADMGFVPETAVKFLSYGYHSVQAGDLDVVAGVKPTGGYIHVNGRRVLDVRPGRPYIEVAVDGGAMWNPTPTDVSGGGWLGARNDVKNYDDYKPTWVAVSVATSLRFDSAGERLFVDLDTYLTLAEGGEYVMHRTPFVGFWVEVDREHWGSYLGAREEKGQ